MTTAEFLSRQAALDARNAAAMEIYAVVVSVVAIAVLSVAWGVL